MTDRADFIAAAEMKPPRRAPYTFARLNEVILPSPVGPAPSHARPLPDGFCGELTVTWRAETPLLIGGSSNDDPVTFGEGGRPVLPGASLRGLVRAVMEIAAYGRLNFVDDARFGLRDYDHITWQRKVRTNPEIQGGWLRFQKADGSALLTEASCVEVPIDGIVAHLSRTLGIVEDRTGWNGLSLPFRRILLDQAGIDGEFDLGLVGYGVPGQRGTLVISGAMRDPGPARRWEAAFVTKAGARQHRIAKAAVRAFETIQSSDGVWSFWEPTFRAGEPIPVLYRGAPNAAADRCPPAARFFMSLTRLMRAPFDHTVHDLARRSQPDLDGNELDLVEALFGWVPEEEPRTPPRQRRGREQARQGRVFFHHASLVGAPPVTYEERSGVTMQPRASFYPFYLRARPASGAEHPVDYDNEHARLAGRKRYPARNRCADALPKPPDPSRERQTVRLRFLPAMPGRPLLFTSRILLHNVSEVELGALVWAVTLGCHGQQNDRGFRHMLGRAKAFGFGQVRAEIAPRGLERNCDGAAPDLGQAMAAFEKWVLASLRSHGVEAASFAELPEIGDLLATAHALTGQGLFRHLRFTEDHGNNPAEMTLNGYRKLRNLSGHGQGGSAPGHAGQPALERPTGDGFVALPIYPRPETPPGPVEDQQRVAVDARSAYRKGRGRGFWDGSQG